MGVCASKPQQEASGPGMGSSTSVAIEMAHPSWPRDVQVAHVEYVRTCKFGLVFSDIERLKAARDLSLTLHDAHTSSGNEASIVFMSQSVLVAQHTLKPLSSSAERTMSEGQRTLVTHLRSLAQSQRPRLNRRLSILRKSDIDQQQQQSQRRNTLSMDPIGESQTEEIANEVEPDNEKDSKGVAKSATLEEAGEKPEASESKRSGRRRTLSDVKLKFSELDYESSPTDSDDSAKDSKDALPAVKESLDTEAASEPPQAPEDNAEGELSRKQSLGVRIMQGHEKSKMTRPQRKWSMLKTATKISGAFRSREITAEAAQSNFDDTASLQAAHPDRLHAIRVLAIHWSEQDDQDKAKQIVQKGISDGEAGLAHSEFFAQSTKVIEAMQADLAAFGD